MDKKIFVSKNNYNFLRDSKTTGMVLVIFAIVMQIFSFLQVPFFSSAHAYTVGMIFGKFSSFFYIFYICIGLKKIFFTNIKIPGWIKFTKLTYWLVVFLLILVVHAWVFGVLKKTKIGSISLYPWKIAFKDWWDFFGDNNYVWAPRNYLGGLLGVFSWSLITMIISPIGTFIVSLIFLIFSIFILIISSCIGLFRNFKTKKSIASKKKYHKNPIQKNRRIKKN